VPGLFCTEWDVWLVNFGEVGSVCGGSSGTSKARSVSSRTPLARSAPAARCDPRSAVVLPSPGVAERVSPVQSHPRGCVCAPSVVKGCGRFVLTSAGSFVFEDCGGTLWPAPLAAAALRLLTAPPVAVRFRGAPCLAALPLGTCEASRWSASHRSRLASLATDHSGLSRSRRARPRSGLQ
jgi:hypothetical protein